MKKNFNRFVIYHRYTILASPSFSNRLKDFEKEYLNMQGPCISLDLSMSDDFLSISEGHASDDNGRSYSNQSKIFKGAAKAFL